MNVEKRTQLFWLAALLLAALTRLYNIGLDSLWLDEGFTIRTASLSFAEMFQRAIGDSQLVFNILLHFWIKVFGDGEIAVRLLPALISLATLIILVRLTTYMFDEKIAWITALIYILSPFQLYFAHEVRTYGLLSLLSLMSVYFLLRLADRNWRLSYLFAYSISTLLLLHAHLYGWFIWAFELTWIAFRMTRDRCNIKQWVLTQAAITLLTLPYVVQLLKIVSHIQQGWWLKKPTLLHLPGTLFQYAGGIPTIFIMIAILATGAVSFMLMGKKRRPDLTQIGFVTAWMAFAILIPFVYSQFGTPIYLPRYTIAASIPFYILVAFAVANLRGRYLRYGVLVVLMLSMSWGLFTNINAPTREPWREAITQLKAGIGPDDVILLVIAERGESNFDPNVFHVEDSEVSIPDIFCYYAQSLPNKIVGMDADDFLTQEAVERLKQRLCANKQTLWFVNSHFDSYAAHFFSEIAGCYSIADRHGYPHRDLYNREVRYIELVKMVPKELAAPSVE